MTYLYKCLTYEKNQVLSVKRWKVPKQTAVGG